MVEFTGERVIPGHVNDDLWSEHLGRYAFARRYVHGKNVLDAGCGTGYGAAELAQDAGRVVGVDLSPEAIRYARTEYASNCAFLVASCLHLPFAEASFDVIVGFEVIEHLTDYRSFLAECARVLKPEGLFIISTPNTSYYAESRLRTGPNPYHEHEFEAREFGDALHAVFPNTVVLLQNRVESFAFYPQHTFWPADARMDRTAGSSEQAHFFVALCSRGKLPEPRSFVYVPRAANVLRERELHIRKLEDELTQTKSWLDRTATERDDLLVLFRKQKEDLEARNRWADQLDAQLAASQERVVELQDQLTREQAAGAATAAGYEVQIERLETENRAKTAWAVETEERLSTELATKAIELAGCVHLLDEREATVEERTLWAQRLDAELTLVRASRWVRLGRKLGLGPVIS